MATVLAALDNSLAVNPVLVMARALARALGAGVQAIHVSGEGAESAVEATRAAGVPLRVSPGPVVDRLVEAGEESDVSALVIGARGTTKSGHPLGSTALAVVTAIGTPVVVVPPAGNVSSRLRRVLVPIDADSAVLTPHSLVELAESSEVDVTVLQVDGAAGGEESSRELLARYCPWGIGRVELERRTGAREDVIVLAAEEDHVDLVALGWARQLSDGRAPAVFAAIERAKISVMLIPVKVEGGRNGGAHSRV
jgi:nucleotide-binding universal stress UspA family protein